MFTKPPLPKLDPRPTSPPRAPSGAFASPLPPPPLGHLPPLPLPYPPWTPFGALRALKPSAYGLGLRPMWWDRRTD